MRITLIALIARIKNNSLQESATAQHYVMLCPTKKVPSENNSF